MCHVLIPGGYMLAPEKEVSAIDAISSEKIGSDYLLRYPHIVEPKDEI